MTQDRLATLTEMRPSISLDQVWTEAEQTAVLERIKLDSTVTKTTSRRRKRPAFVAGAVAVAVMAVPGIAAAVGDGMTPQSFLHAYDYWQGNPTGAVDPRSAHRVGSVAGPAGGVFSVVSATNARGQTCIGPLFETVASSKKPLPDNFESAGSFCEDVPSTKPFEMNTRSYTATATQWFAYAGAAVTATLQMPGGETYPVLFVDGYLFGWYPNPAPGTFVSPVLTGYAANGQQVGQFHV